MSVDMSNHVELMRQALEAAKEGIEAGQSPFGAVIATKDGEVVFTACNRVPHKLRPDGPCGDHGHSRRMHQASYDQPCRACHRHHV